MEGLKYHDPALCYLESIVDLAVGSPERLDFVAGAVCENDLVQKLPEPVFKNGALRDTEKLLDLTDEEERKYQGILKGQGRCSGRVGKVRAT